MKSSDLYREGRLQEAIDAAVAEVKSKPADAGLRSFLADLLCYAGEYDRADKQLDTLSHMQPELAVHVAMARQLIRAARWRQEVFEHGRLPEFSEKPTPALQRQLEAAVHVRAGDLKAASSLLAEGEADRRPIAGVCDDVPFDEFRDLDDMLAPVLEVFTSNGKYYWFAFEQVASVAFDPLERSRDLLWRPARITVGDGPEGQVYVPALYPGSEKSPNEAIRLGRSTEWSGGDDGAPVRGLGQRMFLVGGDARPFLEIQQFEFTQPTE